MRRMRRMMLVICAAALASGCGGTSTGNPQKKVESSELTLRSATYTASRGWGLPFVTSAYAGVTGLKFCFVQAAFTDSAGTRTLKDFAVGEKTLSTAGTELGAVTLATGTYTKVELLLDASCIGGKSVQFTNALGLLSHSTADAMTLTFTTDFTVSTEKAYLDLQFQSHVTALDLVAVDALIKGVLEGVVGSVIGVIGF